MSGVELMRVSVVGVGRCRQRISASRSGGETAAASHSADRLGGEEERRRREWAEFKYLLVMMMRNHGVFTAIGH